MPALAGLDMEILSVKAVKSSLWKWERTFLLKANWLTFRDLGVLLHFSTSSVLWLSVDF